MADYPRIARALPNLKTAAASAESGRSAESPKIDMEADQVELERAAPASAMSSPGKAAGALAGGSAKVKPLLSALTRRIPERMIQGMASGPVTRDQHTFPGSLTTSKK